MDPFLGEIRAVGFNFAPRGWALCQGQLLAISQSTALFSLLGTTYGGDGRSTFALPDLQGRAIVQTGQGPGLSQYVQGEETGTETVTLLSTQLPAHSHTVTGSGASSTIATNSITGNSTSPANNYLANAVGNQYGEEAVGTMAAGSVSGTAGSAGGNLPHNNLMPYLALYYIIALVGIYPQRP